jgi:hypothetical protein
MVVKHGRYIHRGILGVREQGVENIWTAEILTKKRMEKFYNEEFHNSTLH